MQTTNVLCLCCGSRTLTAPGVFELCPVCWWQDDGQDEADADGEGRAEARGRVPMGASVVDVSVAEGAMWAHGEHGGRQEAP